MARYKALIVEDSTLMRELLRISLSRLVDVEFDEADDGLAGVKMLAKSKYDLVIADINMPVMDGLKLVRHIRDDARHKDIPIIIITTEGRSDDVERVKQMGVQAYLTKPVTGVDVIRTVEKLLNLS